jgi:hypothetical protein
MIYKVVAIISPYAFIEDNKKSLLRIVIADIENFKHLRIGSAISKNVDGMFSVIGNIIDTDCVGGVCPIK